MDEQSLHATQKKRKDPSTFLRDLLLLSCVHEELQRAADEKEIRARSLTPFCLFCRLCPIDSMFPEGISRYHPQLAPFKAGVAMIASDVSEKKSDIAWNRDLSFRMPYFRPRYALCTLLSV